MQAIAGSCLLLFILVTTVVGVRMLLLARRTVQHGRLALAGLLAEQAGEVRAAYGPWFDFEAPEVDEGWALLSGIRR